jgi:hypothetical protein
MTELLRAGMGGYRRLIEHVWVRRGSAQKTAIPQWARAGLKPWYEPANA